MKVNSLTNKDAWWPNTLNNLYITPDKLYYEGSLLSGPRVGIIGSRRPTPYGQYATRQIARELASAGVTIVSGLAIGIDGMAHQAALEANGKTVAVLPSSLDSIYPSRHTRLARNIVEAGSLLISEYPNSHRPRREDFIARNRIIAAFCDVLLVIESNIKSGTSHTVNFALELGIDVAAVPGRIDSKLSRGTHNIIKNGGALIESGTDVLNLLGMNAVNSAEIQIDKKYAPIIACLQNGDNNPTGIALKIGTGLDEIFTLLLELEAIGKVARSPDGVYDLRS